MDLVEILEHFILSVFKETRDFLDFRPKIEIDYLYIFLTSLTRWFRIAAYFSSRPYFSKDNGIVASASRLHQRENS